jgi:hypothetical protein
MSAIIAVIHFIVWLICQAPFISRFPLDWLWKNCWSDLVTFSLQPRIFWPQHPVFSLHATAMVDGTAAMMDVAIFGQASASAVSSSLVDQYISIPSKLDQPAICSFVSPVYLFLTPLLHWDIWAKSPQSH